jgi:hypothetical protein
LFLKIKECTLFTQGDKLSMVANISSAICTGSDHHEDLPPTCST